MDSIGIINASYIVEYDKNSENYENLDNKFIVKVKSSSLDDVIILFKESNFERFIREAFNCFIVCVEFDNIEEEEEIDDEYTAMRLEGTFKADRLIILQLNQSLWIKNCLQRKFFNMKSAKMWKYKNFLEDLNFGENILNSKLEFMHAIDYIKPETGEFVIKMIKLFKFSNQKEVDRKLFEVAIDRKCSFEIIQSMISFHKSKEASSNGMVKHEVDALFLARGITVFDEEVIENYRQELRKNDKEKITDEIEKFHGNEKSLLQHLCSKSRVALATNDVGDDRLKKIEQYYQNLIDLSEDAVTDLLRIVDHKLLIIFDFDSNSIERSYLMGTKNNRGIFDQDRMRIFIGAKNSHDTSSDEYTKREWEIVGILIHEVCHYVNFKVFNNNCKPFFKNNDEVNEQIYEEIVDEYNPTDKNGKPKVNLSNQPKEVWEDHNEIVGRVFEYNKSMWHAELIVRVAQMIVTYKILDPERLKELEEKYQKLFSYFFDVVIPQVKTYLDPDNQLKRQIKEVSSFSLEKFEIKPIIKPLKYDQEKYVHFVEANVPKLAIANFCLNFVKDFAIFTTIMDLMDEFKGKEILSLWDWRIKIVIYCDKMYEDSKYFDECIGKLDNSFRKNQIFFIFEENSESIQKMRRKFTKRIEHLEKLNFGFLDLTEESKENILRKNVIFQGNNVKLEKIVTKDSSAATILPLNHFLESSDSLIIGKLPEKNADYDDKVFIQRKLSNKTEEKISEFSTEKMDEILSILSTNQYIIISDEVGKGKSTLMTHLAYQFLQSTLSHIERKFFVVKINLHQHSNVLSKFNDHTSLDKFIFENFVKKSCFEEFEWKIFEEYYNEGKLILMLDGFDEIAPNCEEQTFQIIEEIVNSGKSNVIVTTRPLYVQKLNRTEAIVLNLELLSIQDQLSFLTNYLKSHEGIRINYSDADIDDLCTKSLHRMLTSVKESYDSKGQFINLMLSFPLHLRMFADVICNKIVENKTDLVEAMNSITSFKVYHLYDDFFQNKVKIGQEEKGKIVKDDIRYLENKGFKRLQLFDCAGKLAWNTLHPAFKANPLEINDKEKKFLQRYGIVSVRNNEIYFVHRSYPEYFIAHLFLENLINGTLLSSHFAQNHFLIDVLTLVEYESIKGFIDTALSDEDIYQEITSESFNDLGQLVIKEYKAMEGNDKNFLHCVIEHAKRYSARRSPRCDYVFISHLLINSLMYCDSEDDIETIKNILERPWDENSQYIDSTGVTPISAGVSVTSFSCKKSDKNIFHLTCSLGINCLVSAIWKLAEKVYGNEAKNYFLIRSSHGREKIAYVLELALLFQPLTSNPLNCCKVNIRNCLEIEELRKLKYINDEDDINLDGEHNFHHSTIFLLLQIIRKFNLTEEELESLCPAVSEIVNFYTTENIFLHYNFYFYFISNFFNSKSSRIVNNLKLRACYVAFGAIGCLHENVRTDTIKILTFLKGKLSEEYKIFIREFFAIFFESDSLPFHVWHMFDMETKAQILYFELKEAFSNSDDICRYFQYNPRLTSHFLRNGNYNDIRCCLEVYFKVLHDDHLTRLLLNLSCKSLNIINHIVVNFPMECLDHFLKLLESRYIDKQKLYHIVESSCMLAFSTMNEEKFSKINEFCKKNFEKPKVEVLMLKCLHLLSRLYKQKVMQKKNKYTYKLKRQ